MINVRFATLGLTFALVCLMSSTTVVAMLVANPAARCSCECVDGVPQTLCGSVHAAQQQTWVCPPSYTCPLPSTVQPRAERLVAPHPQAENCRAVRVWHRQRQAYTGVNICDVRDPVLRP